MMPAGYKDEKGRQWRECRIPFRVITDVNYWYIKYPHSPRQCRANPDTSLQLDPTF